MVGFQRLGTVRGFKFEQQPLPMVKDRSRSGSDPLHLYSSSSDEHVESPKYGESTLYWTKSIVSPSQQHDDTNGLFLCVVWF